MEFKYAKLPENPTREDIKAEITKLKNLKTDQGNKDQALKIILNSTYGVIGFANFICYHRDVAQTVTKQSEDLIKYTIDFFNEYFEHIWAEDAETHAKMDITRCKPMDIKAVNYADTDSIFLVLEKARKATDYKGDLVQFATDIYKYALKPFIDKKLEEYIIKYNGLNFMNDENTKTLALEMESVEHTVLMVAKKKYIKDTAFKKKIRFEKLDNVTVKGLELNQSATPRFIRTKLKTFVDFILKTEGAIDISSLVDFLIDIKEQFMVKMPDEISKIERITDYEKFITHNRDEKGNPIQISIAANCKPHVRAGGFHNYMLDLNPELRTTYDRIGTGHKVNWYYAIDRNRERNMDVFGFLAGQYPIEFAPEVDYGAQFEATFLGPVNNILKVMGVSKLGASLIYNPVFKW